MEVITTHCVLIVVILVLIIAYLVYITYYKTSEHYRGGFGYRYPYHSRYLNHYPNYSYPYYYPYYYNPYYREYMDNVKAINNDNNNVGYIKQKESHMLPYKLKTGSYKENMSAYEGKVDIQLKKDDASQKKTGKPMEKEYMDDMYEHPYEQKEKMNKVKNKDGMGNYGYYTDSTNPANYKSQIYDLSY
jgi:hypothetical protein